MTRLWLAIALLLPLIVLASQIASEEALRRNAQIITVPITGFDPRSLVYGQYIEFRFAWAAAVEQCAEPGECCLCVSGDDPPAATAFACETAPQQCRAVLRPAPDEPGRFWLNEDDAARLEPMLRAGEADFAMRLAVAADGRWRLQDLLVDGEPYRLDQR